MDETRDRAYQQLIQTLLTCPNGEENQILNANSELVDAELVQMMIAVAAQLSENNQENAANFLLETASQIANFLGMKDDGDSNNSESENPQEYEKFIRELLQAEQDSNSDIKVIYSMLDQRQHLLNSRFAQILHEVAEILIAEHLKAIEFIVALIENLSVHISEFPRGNRANNIEIAITGYQIVLNNREPGSEDWAMTQNNLAIAYSNRINGSRANNLEQAIWFCEAALKIRTLEGFPEQWATTQNNLANAYRSRINGSRAENLEQAIGFYQQALTVYTLEAFPEKWATAQNNLAAAYSDRIKGSRADNLERAIAFFQAALTVRTLEDFPEQWATTQNNLAIAYSNRINGSRADNLERAIGFFNEALTVYTLEGFPEQWATTQNNLAVAYSDRINGSRANNLEQAIGFYEAALTVYTRENFPEDWAMTQNNRANAYRSRINGSRAENLERAERAIGFLNEALTVYTLEDFPEDWAMTQNNLAAAYSNRINCSSAENLERAIDFYDRALTVHTREKFPQKYTETLFNKGNLYQSNQEWQLAYDTYALAIETVEFLRGEIQSGDESKQKLAEEWNKLYLGMVEVCIELQCYAEAVEFADRSKGQNLIELLSVKDLYPKGKISLQLRQELQNLRIRIADENKRLKQAEDKNYTELEKLRQDLNEKYPYTPLDFGKIQQLVDEKTAIVEWYILENSFCVFIITNDNSQPQILPFTESDFKRLIDWRDEYLLDYDSNPQQWQNSLGTKLEKLAQILDIDQIVNAIPKTCNRLILIPHRYLHLFPLHALPLTNNTAKYLIDAFPGGVSYTPSCQLLHQVQKYKRGKLDKLFAIQNPTNNLLAADMQVESIKNIFPNSEVLAKGNAKKGAQLDGKLEIAEKVADSHHLFFSCHGSFDRNDPLQSGLELADGTLTLEEIIRYFNLSECSLVTLSSCETGQVQLDETDEYISLTSGFLLAGSPSLYVSLWSVNALSTAILMIKTYENLSNQPGKFALSLNQAQIWMRDTDIQGVLDWKNQCHLLDAEWRKTLQDNMDVELENHGTNAKIYENPYHWAGFCAAGKGEQNMSNSITKLEIFQKLIELDLFVNLKDALVSLKEQWTGNDEDNVELIEKWIQELPENDKKNIQKKYTYYQLNVEMLGRDGKSSTKPGGQSEILKEVLENAVVRKEKPPEPKPDTPSSP